MRVFLGTVPLFSGQSLRQKSWAAIFEAATGYIGIGQFRECGQWALDTT